MFFPLLALLPSGISCLCFSTWQSSRAVSCKSTSFNANTIFANAFHMSLKAGKTIHCISLCSATRNRRNKFLDKISRCRIKLLTTNVLTFLANNKRSSMQSAEIQSLNSRPYHELIRGLSEHFAPCKNAKVGV